MKREKLKPNKQKNINFKYAKRKKFSNNDKTERI